MISKWKNFWFATCSRESFCLLRIYTGIFLCMRLMGIWGLYRINELSAKFPMHRFRSESGYMLDAFRMPLPFFEWLPVPSLFYYRLIFEWGMFFLAILFTLGLLTRFVAPLLALLLLYWTCLSQFFYYHHMVTFLFAILVLGFSNCWQHYSLDSYIFGKKISKKEKTIFPIRQLQIIISIIYLFSFIAKFNSGWFEGKVLESMAHIGAIKGIFSPIVFEYISFKAMSLFTLFAEGVLIFGLWFNKTRSFALFIGVIFHLGIDATMGVATFSYQMLALYLVFLLPNAKSTTVNIPDQQNWQIFSRICNLFDWFRRINWQSNTSKFSVISHTGQSLTGFQALINVLLKLPATFLFAWPISLFFVKSKK